MDARHTDTDGDDVCDQLDNCVSIPNPGQENCNVLAEKEAAWGHGTYLGDACDPAPCPAVSLDWRRFEPWGIALPAGGSSSGGGGIDPTFDVNSTTIYMQQRGRDIQDDVRITPVLEDGSGTVSSSATVRFCDCRNPQQKVLANPNTCSIPPYNCLIDPRQTTWQETSAQNVSVPQTRTAWHPIGTAGIPVQVGESVPLTYPGLDQQRRWVYVHDYQAWTAAGWMDPANLSPTDPPGTNLGGALWGALEVCPDSSCPRAGAELRVFYNNHRPHAAFEGRTPTEVYFGRAAQPALLAPSTSLTDVCAGGASCEGRCGCRWHRLRR